MKQIFFFGILSITYVTNCSRILVIPLQGKLHMIYTNTIGQELKNKGHEVRGPIILNQHWSFPYMEQQFTEFSEFKESDKITKT